MYLQQTSRYPDEAPPLFLLILWRRRLLLLVLLLLQHLLLLLCLLGLLRCEQAQRLVLLLYRLLGAVHLTEACKQQAGQLSPAVAVEVVVH